MKMDMLKYMRILIGNDFDVSTVTYLINSVTSKVLKYTRRAELDEGLAMVVCEIAAQRYKTQNLGTADAAMTVSSISDGDQSMSFKHNDSALATCAELTDGEKATLNEWRRLW